MGIRHRRTDGGASWVPQLGNIGYNLLGVYFINSNTGIVVGDGGTILRTITGRD